MDVVHAGGALIVVLSSVAGRNGFVLLSIICNAKDGLLAIYDNDGTLHASVFVASTVGNCVVLHVCTLTSQTLPCVGNFLAILGVVSRDLSFFDFFTDLVGVLVVVTVVRDFNARIVENEVRLLMVLKSIGAN
jgi:uncharacterized membrane protein YeaQ/YmgE (transglycosylase-associated protein family)